MKKQRTETAQSPSQSVLLAVCVGAIAFYVGYISHSATTPPPPPANDHQLLINAIDSMTEDTYAFSKSNLEWVTANIGLTPKEFMKQSLIATTAQGTVTEASQTQGSLNVLSKHYYVGNPGTYAYNGSISLTGPDTMTKTFYFSPKRMEMMKVYRVSGARMTPVSFSDIQSGKSAEIEETVDLTKPNINDENLVSLVVRILQ